MHFSIFDWLILATSLVLIFYIGISARKYVTGMPDFLLAGRNVGLYVGALSLLSADTAIVTFMYYAQMGFLYGFTALVSAFIPVVAYVFLGRSGLVIKAFREMELVTISEYFQEKYGRRLRVLAGLLMGVGGALNFGAFPIIDATFLNIVTGIPRRNIIVTMLCLMILVLLYTALGGMLSVVAASYLQYVFLLLGMVIATVFCLRSVGFPSMVHVVDDKMGGSGFNPFLHPAFGWSFIFWQLLSWLASLTGYAPVTVRAFSSESSEIGKKMFALTGVLYWGRSVLPIIWGIAALAYFHGQWGVSIEAMPTQFRNVLPVGISGLVIAGMLAGTMSTYSGCLIAWSSVISQDVIIPLTKKRLSEKAQLRINQVTILCLAVFVVVWGLFYVIPGAAYFYLYMTANLFLAGTFWAVVGGLYWKEVHKLGAYCALILGAGTTLIYFFVPNPGDWAGRIGLASYILSFLGLYVGSLVGNHLAWIKDHLILVVLIPVSSTALWFYKPIKGYGPWLSVWIWFVVLGVVSFICLSIYAIVRALSDVKRLFHYKETTGTSEDRKQVP